MKLYIKNKSTGSIEPTNLRAILLECFSKNEIFEEVAVGEFSDDSDRWLEIKQHTATREVSINISFDKDLSGVTELSIWESDIRRIVDDENAKRII